MLNKPMNPKPVTRIGQASTEIARGAFQPFKDAAAWLKDQSRIPRSPGVYLLRSLKETGAPVRFEVVLGTGGPATPEDIAAGRKAATREDVERRCEWLQGVVYIGKAVNLFRRFGTQLCPSWNPPYPSLHTSKQNWDEEPTATRDEYPSDRMRMTFKQMSAKDWQAENTLEALLALLEPELPEIGEWFRANHPSWTETHGNCLKNPNVAATISEEQALLRLFRQCFGRFPALNRDLPKDEFLDDEWLEALFEGEQDPETVDEEADRAVEMTTHYDRADPPFLSTGPDTD